MEQKGKHGKRAQERTQQVNTSSLSLSLSLSLSPSLSSFPIPYFRHQGRAPEACLLFADGGQLPHHGAVVPDETGDALPRQGRWVDGCVGLHRQQLHPVGYPHEQPVKNYEVRGVLRCGTVRGRRREREGHSRVYVPVFLSYAGCFWYVCTSMVWSLHIRISSTYLLLCDLQSLTGPNERKPSNARKNKRKIRSLSTRGWGCGYKAFCR